MTMCATIYMRLCVVHVRMFWTFFSFLFFRRKSLTILQGRQSNTGTTREQRPRRRRHGDILFFSCQHPSSPFDFVVEFFFCVFRSSLGSTRNKFFRINILFTGHRSSSLRILYSMGCCVECLYTRSQLHILQQTHEHVFFFFFCACFWLSSFRPCRIPFFSIHVHILPSEWWLSRTLLIFAALFSHIRSSFNFRTMCVVGVCAAPASPPSFAASDGISTFELSYILYTAQAQHTLTHSCLLGHFVWSSFFFLLLLATDDHLFCFHFDKKWDFFFFVDLQIIGVFVVVDNVLPKVYFCTHAIRQTMRNESKRDGHTKEDENCKNEGWPALPLPATAADRDDGVTVWI